MLLLVVMTVTPIVLKLGTMYAPELVNGLLGSSVGQHLTIGDEPAEPEPPTEDQITMDKANNSKAGIQLTQGGYAAIGVVDHPGVIKFLDANQDHPGKYVLYRAEGGHRVPLDGPNEEQAKLHASDRIIDANTGIMVAVSEVFKSNRGLMCLNSSPQLFFPGVWTQLNKNTANLALNNPVSLREGEQFSCYLFKN